MGLSSDFWFAWGILPILMGTFLGGFALAFDWVGSNGWLSDPHTQSSPQGSVFFWGVVLGCFVVVLIAAVRSYRRYLPTYQLLGGAFPEKTANGQPVSFSLLPGRFPVAFTAGLLIPRVYLTQAAVELLTVQEQDIVLSHEHEHIRKKDPLRYLLLTFCEYWLPGARYIRRQWQKRVEIECDQGWSAEYSIPFKILRFSGAEEQVWGINFERVIKRNNESVYWSGWERDFGFYNISQAGHLEGLIDIKQAERFRIRPYLLGGVENFAATLVPEGTEAVGDVGIDDFKIAVTSNLTADLAFNPDFGQVEADAQQVNLTRFSLFFSEKRPFFIEGAQQLRMGLGLLHFGPPPMELFHSRRIGLSDAGEPIPIIAGGKLTGKVGAYTLGFLNVQTNDFDPGLPGTLVRPGENFTVARFRREILGRSYFGAIFTNRQGGGLYNRLAGLDARFVLKKYFHLMGMLAKSFTSGISDNDWLTQIGADWRTDFFTAGINYMDIEPNFIPGIGFLRRRDRTIGSRVILKPRPGGELIRNFEIQPSLVYYHNEDRVLKSRNADLGFDIVFQSGDKVQFDFGNDVERLFRPFRIAPGVILPEGRYQWNAGGVSFSTFNGRKLAASAGFSIGDFYDGTKNSFSLAGEFRPNEKMSFSPSYQFNDIDLIEGSFNTQLFGLRADISFTNSLLTSTFLQYDSPGDLAALQVRFNYIFRTIDNFFIVYKGPVLPTVSFRENPTAP